MHLLLLCHLEPIPSLYSVLFHLMISFLDVYPNILSDIYIYEDSYKRTH